MSVNINYHWIFTLLTVIQKLQSYIPECCYVRYWIKSWNGSKVLLSYDVWQLLHEPFFVFCTAVFFLIVIKSYDQEKSFRRCFRCSSCPCAWLKIAAFFNADKNCCKLVKSTTAETKLLLPASGVQKSNLVIIIRVINILQIILTSVMIAFVQKKLFFLH